MQEHNYIIYFMRRTLFGVVLYSSHKLQAPPPGGGTRYNALYGEAPPERDTLFRLQVYKRVGILQGLGL